MFKIRTLIEYEYTVEYKLTHRPVVCHNVQRLTRIDYANRDEHIRSE